mmetsp:Transcript_63268/g.137643  ORF Transcript_63268/g.137643 Transcript_63268/m.137643 type:complete len:347 (+) Transcript_63268:58-1098(+)
MADCALVPLLSVRAPLGNVAHRPLGALSGFGRDKVVSARWQAFRLKTSKKPWLFKATVGQPERRRSRMTTAAMPEFVAVAGSKAQLILADAVASGSSLAATVPDSLHIVGERALAVAGTAISRGKAIAASGVHGQVGLVVGSCSAGLFLGFAVAKLMHRLRTYRTADMIPSDLIRRHASIKGRVLSVADGDTLRIRHMPVLRRGFWAKRRLSDDTISVRIAGVDTPETAKLGNPGQPFGSEAKALTEKLVKGKVVHCKLLSRDQYNRVVCTVEYSSPRLFPPRLRANLSKELLKRGLAVVYRGGGAEYGGHERSYERLEKTAKAAKRGVWSQENFETPAEYKAKNK